jgi:phage antirepressor YoqD-like protein
MGSDCLFEMSAVAKNINFKGMGRNNLFKYLQSKEILRYNDEPYQRFVDSGYFKIIKQSFVVNGKDKINRKTMTTQKGLDYITKLLLGDGYECNDR